MLHAQIYTEKRKGEKNWLFTPPLQYTKELLYVDYRRRETQKQFHFSVVDNSVAVLFVYGQGNRITVALVLPLAQNLKTV